MKSVSFLLVIGGLAALSWGVHTTLSSRALDRESALPVPIDASPSHKPELSEERPVSTAANIAEDLASASEKPVARTTSPSITGAREKDQYQDLLTLRRELSRLKAEVASLHLRLEGQTDLIMDAILLAIDRDNVTPGSLTRVKELARTEAERRQREQADVIETALGSESIDEEWSIQAIEAIERAFDHEELAETLVFDLDCRSTLCRVEASYDDQKDFAEFKMWFSLLAANSFGQFTIDHADADDGQNATVIYLARKGYDLPEAESVQ